MTPEAIVLLALATPLAGALLILCTGFFASLREAVSLLTASSLFLLALSLYAPVMEGIQPAVTLLEIMPGLSLTFRVEPLGLLFAIIASFLWIVTTIYSIGYMRSHGEKNLTRFYFFFAVSIAATIGIAFSGNLLTLFVFYEALTLSTFPLVAHQGTDKARRNSRVYLGILISTSILFFLFAIAWTWLAAGTLDFTPGGILAGKVEGPAVSILLALYVFGIGKAALIPFHRWLPAAMAAPAPVSALLHAVAVVKAGVFSILKVAIYVFGTDFMAQTGAGQVLQWVAAATILIASLTAMTQDNLKVRLAYSTVSQLSYIVLGAMLASQLGIIGGGMHIAVHAFGKITLFFCAGAIVVASHKTEVSQLSGIGRTMPFTMAAFLIGSLTIIGLPPLGGVWSKWYLALGALQADQVVMVAVLMISSLLNVAYLLPIPFRGFFAKPSDSDDHNTAEAPIACLIAIGVTSAGCLALFFYPDPLYALVKLLVAP